MKISHLLMILTVLLLTGGTTTALELGATAVRAYNSNDALGDLHGVSLYAHQGLSRKVSLSGTYTWLQSDDRVWGTFDTYGGMAPPPFEEPLYETMDEETSAWLVDLNLLHRLAHSERMVLSAGAGLGLAHLERQWYGLTTEKHGTTDATPLFYGLLVDIEVKQIASLPLGLRLGYHYRYLFEIQDPLGPGPLGWSNKMSAVQAGFVYQF